MLFELTIVSNSYFFKILLLPFSNFIPTIQIICAYLWWNTWWKVEKNHQQWNQFYTLIFVIKDVELIIYLNFKYIVNIQHYYKYNVKHSLLNI